MCANWTDMKKELGLRSPHVKTGGLVYFGRMLDKIRAHAKGELPEDYQANLGRGFDASCIRFLRVNYDQIVERVKQAARTKKFSMVLQRRPAAIRG